MKAYERLLKYITYETQADGTGKSETVPSTPGQTVFARALMEELKALGIEAVMDEKSYIYGSLPGNVERHVPVVGFIAHMDTATNFPGPGNTARLIENYDGSVLQLCEGVAMDPEKMPSLKASVGNDLIVTNGKTLLGGDDKAGVAEIMTALEYMREHPEFPHGEVAFIFTPDEEIGGSTKHIDLSKTTAEVAYTLDGEEFGTVEYQNFSKGAFTAEIKGVAAHPAYAKDLMKNALIIAAELHNMMPPWQRPEHTEGFDGYFHLVQMEGTPHQCKMAYLINFHTVKEYEERKEFVRHIADFLNMKYGAGTVQLEFIDGKMCVEEKIEARMELIDFAKEEIKNCGAVPQVVPMRGGTDGVALTAMGLLCPNLGTGSYNHHAVNEFANVQEMDKCVELILRLVGRFSQCQ